MTIASIWRDQKISAHTRIPRRSSECSIGTIAIPADSQIIAAAVLYVHSSATKDIMSFTQREVISSATAVIRVDANA